MIGEVDNSVMWELAINLGIILLIMSFAFFIIMKSIDSIKSFLGLNKTAKKATKKKTSTKNKSTKTANKTTKTKQAKPHNLLRSDNEILTIPLDELSWREFERLCFLYFKAKGKKPQETAEGADGGVDLIYFDRYHNANVAVQIKKYKSGNQITVREIRELKTAKNNHNCGLAEFITTSTFTNDALLQADKYRIKTFDGNWVQSNILKWRDIEAKKKNLA